MGSLSDTVVWGILWRTEKSDPPKPPPGRLQRSPEIDSYYTVSFQSRARGFQKIMFVFLQCSPGGSSGGGSSSRGIFLGT